VCAVIDRDESPLEFGRVLSLSDAVFGVAMTLLVISIVVVPGLSSREFTSELWDLLPRIAIMALSFAVAASAWLEHHRLFGRLQRIDAGIHWRNFVLLGLVALIPFPHQVLGAYPQESLSYVLYATVLAAVNAMTVLLALHARRRRLFRSRHGDVRLEVARGVLDMVVFGASIPLAFVLVGWTPLIWVALLPLERLLARRMRRTTAPHPNP
jgi:uncharacterized membrane protein